MWFCARCKDYKTWNLLWLPPDSRQQILVDPSSASSSIIARSPSGMKVWWSPFLLCLLFAPLCWCLHPVLELLVAPLLLATPLFVYQNQCHLIHSHLPPSYYLHPHSFFLFLFHSFMTSYPIFLFLSFFSIPFLGKNINSINI